jgi:hypothetical protein
MRERARGKKRGRKSVSELDKMKMKRRKDVELSSSNISDGKRSERRWRREKKGLKKKK